MWVPGFFLWDQALHFGVVFLVFSSLELFGHWYLFWSYVVASAFTGTRYPGVHGFRHLEVCKGPWSLRGSRGYAPMGADGGNCSLQYAVFQMLSLFFPCTNRGDGYMGLMAVHAACCTQYTSCCPFGPCTGAVHGAPGHNRWEVVETPLPVKTQGRTMNCFFNKLA